MECFSCKFRYNKSVRRPIISTCGHTICELCRTSLTQCPKCKQIMNKDLWILNNDTMERLQDKGDELDLLIKLYFVGESGAGKTSLIRRMVGQKFTLETQLTIGLDFKYVDKEMNGLVFRFQLWDTAGQERFRAATNLIYKDADIIVLVYDVTENIHPALKYWQQQIHQKCKENVRTVYIANKIDLKQNNLIQLKGIQASCKTDQGLDQVWKTILQESLKIPASEIIQKRKEQKAKKMRSFHRRREYEAKKSCC